MSIETTPSSEPDPQWEQVVGNYFSAPAAEPTIPAQAAPAAVAEPAPDLLGDTPLVPAWTKSSSGWKARAAVGRTNSTRSFRRWVRRQAGEHGHAAQTFRGIRRVAVWVHGTEGVEVAKAKHDVRLAHKDYRNAQWALNRKLLPGKEQKQLRADLDKASAVSEAAMGKYRAARGNARTRRTLRAAAALAPVAGVEGAGLHFLGAPGGIAAAGATLAALALIGRRTSAGELYTDRDAKIGDGDRMTDEMLNRVYRDAKVIGADQVLTLLMPCSLAADGSAWEVSFDLPSGVPTSKATGALAPLAGGFGVSTAQVSQTAGDREGRVNLRVSLKIPFTGKPVRGPLLDLDRITLWDAVPMGISDRGKHIAVEWFEKTALFGGEPGSGKSAAANGVLLAAALDAPTRMFLADGKGGFDLTPFEDIAEMIDTDGAPEALLEILHHVWEVVLPECKALVKEHGVRKFSRALAQKDPRCRFTILYIDEWASYMAAAETKVAKELERLLRLITQQGRAYGVIVIAATQKPDSDAVPTGIRDIISTRWAGRCLTPEASDTILGKGRATAGYSAQKILKSQRGVGFFQTGETAEPDLMLSYWYEDDEVELILERARQLRAEAGTLPVTAEPEVTILDHLIVAAEKTGRGNVTRAEAFAYLATTDAEFVQADEENDARYASRAGTALKERLASLGVEVPAVQFPHDGKRVWGWTLEALREAR